jgi:hypothetical protein
MAATGMHNLGEGCSNIVEEGNTCKRPRGRPVKVGHYHDDLGPSHFARVVMSLGLEIVTNSRRPHEVRWQCLKDHCVEDKHGC